VAIAWSDVPPDILERLAAVLVSTELPRAQRMAASRGDHGIDIFNPRSDGLNDVYQVKRFVGRLTSARKRAITASFDRVRSTHAERIGTWNLVIPMAPTPEARTWFQELTADADDFECHWRGDTFLDRLAASNAPAVDYYLHDGKARLEHALRDLATLIGLKAAIEDGAAIRPGEATALISGLVDAVNAADPHFDY